MIGFGLAVLRLPPAAFWALTLPELAALIGRTGGGAAPGRAEVEALMRRFPDGGAEESR